MRKGCNTGENYGGGTFLVATNVVASWLPERRTTGTPHARANVHFYLSMILFERTLHLKIFANSKVFVLFPPL